MEDYRHKVDGVSLSEEDIYNLEMWNWALEQNGEETVSMFAQRFGEKYDDEWREQSYVPCLRAVTAFYTDNGIEEDSLNNEWENIFNTKTFRLNRCTKDAVNEARLLFNDKITQLKSQETIKSSYDTEWLFRACMGMTMWEISQICIDRLNNLRDSDFFKDGIFSKYQITALSHADEMCLDNFKPERDYDEFDIEIMLIRIGLYDSETGMLNVDKMKLAEKVRAIVCSDINRPLKETKQQVEDMAKADRHLKCDLAYLYTSAVVEWYLKNNS